MTMCNKQDYLNILMISYLYTFATYSDCGGFADLLCYYYLYINIITAHLTMLHELDYACQLRTLGIKIATADSCTE